MGYCVLQLPGDFVNVKKKHDELMKEYWNRLKSMPWRLSNEDCGFTNKVSLVMLMGLPETYEPLISKLEQDEATLTAKEVSRRKEEAPT